MNPYDEKETPEISRLLRECMALARCLDSDRGHVGVHRNHRIDEGDGMERRGWRLSLGFRHTEEVDGDDEACLRKIHRLLRLELVEERSRAMRRLGEMRSSGLSKHASKVVVERVAVKRMDALLALGDPP